VPDLIAALALFAPGLVGFGVIATMSRVMMALGRLKVAAVAVAGSWLVVIAADAVLAEIVPPRLVVAALAWATASGRRWWRFRSCSRPAGSAGPRPSGGPAGRR